jgi:hypothetical protein
MQSLARKVNAPPPPPPPPPPPLSHSALLGGALPGGAAVPQRRRAAGRAWEVKNGGGGGEEVAECYVVPAPVSAWHRGIARACTGGRGADPSIPAALACQHGGRGATDRLTHPTSPTGTAVTALGRLRRQPLKLHARPLTISVKHCGMLLRQQHEQVGRAQSAWTSAGLPPTATTPARLPGRTLSHLSFTAAAAPAAGR